MIKFNQQMGSSTTGFLTASSIYVALLAYANFYAFNADSTPETASVESSSTPIAAETPAAAIVAPLAKGIFESETIAVNKTDNDSQQSIENTLEEEPAIQLSIKQPAVDQTAEPSISGETTAANLATPQQKTGWNKRPSAATAVPNVLARPSYAVYQDNDELSMATNDRLSGRMDHQHYYHGLQNGRGYGRGRGNMKGDGEFDFSMNFKSRARMDADSDWDGDFNTDLSSYNHANYYQGSALHPAYRYYYQNYNY